MYLVLEELPKTKSGARCLLVADFSLMVDKFILTPMANVERKYMMHINSDRFEWKHLSNDKLRALVNKRKDEYVKKQEQIQDETIQSKFTNKERMQMAYTPYLYAELAWHYAFKAVAISAERKVDDLKKAVRTIRQLRADFLSELRKKMSQPVIDAAQDKVIQALAEHSLDFFKFENTIKNEVEREYLGSKNNDIRAYAYMSMLCYESQRRVDIDNAKLISRKLGGVVEEVESYKYMKELYENIGKCLGAYYIPHTDNIKIAVKVMEKNIGSMTLN